LIYNTTDPLRLGININGTAAEAWKSYLNTYNMPSEVALANAEQELRNMMYIDGQDFTAFISQLHTKWTIATALGTKIDDLAFRMILLNSLSRSWDSIMTTLYTTKSSHDAINYLMSHWARVSQTQAINPCNTAAALHVNGNNANQQYYNQCQCTNPNCNRRGHTIENCYWSGRGKARQFPPGFGKHKPKGTINANNTNTIAAATTSTTTLSSTQQTSANAVNGNREQVFALIADISPEVQPPKTLFCIRSNPTYTLIRPFESNLVFGMADIRDVLEVGHNDRTFSISECHNVAMSIEKILTLLDSGTSDHCFITKSWFSSYNMISPPRRENSAGKDSTFTIDGTGVAEFSTTIDGIVSRIKMNDTLHMPQLQLNLISVSKLVGKGMTVVFEGETARVKRPDRVTILVVVKRGGLYIVAADNVINGTSEVNTFQTKRKVMTFEVWHRRLGHAGAETITGMINSGLVDGLEVTGPTELKALCKDCIYGTHTTHPFHDSIATETDPLECVYINIWGPASTLLAGGSKYFMLIVDGTTSYRTVYFLSSKSVDATLGAFKDFHYQAE